jgi:Mn-containing catalase
MQYSVQGLNCEDAARKDLFMDIGTAKFKFKGFGFLLARDLEAPTKKCSA